MLIRVGGVLCPAVFLLFSAAQHHLNDQREGAQVDDGGNDDIGNILVVSCQVCKLLTDNIQHGHEDGGEDHADGIVGCQKRHGDAVKAGGRQGLISGPEELRVAGEPVQRCSSAGQTAGDCHGQNDIPLVVDTRVPGGMTIGAAGFQLIAQGGFGHQNINKNGNPNGDQNAAIDLRIGEQLVQSHFGGLDTVKAGFVDIAALGVLNHVAIVAAVKNPGYQIGGNPVGHDACQNLVDVQERLDQTGNGAPECACQNTAGKGDDPDQPGGDNLRGNPQCQHQRCGGAHQILTRRADVEKTRFEGDGDGKTGQSQRRGSEEHIADTLGIEAPGQLTGGIASGAENTGKDQTNALPGAGQGQLLAEKPHYENENAADQQTDDDGKQGSQHASGAILLNESGKLLLHACSRSFPSRFAPAIYRPSS